MLLFSVNILVNSGKPGTFLSPPLIALLLIAHALPVVLFRQGIVFPYFGPVAVAWLSCAGAATPSANRAPATLIR